MIEAFKPPPIANEGSMVDRFGNPLDVGSYVAFADDTEVKHGRIIEYNWLYYQVAYTMQLTKNGILQPLSAVCSNYTNGLPGASLVNIDSLITPALRDLEDPLYAPLLNFSPSETKKVSRKYVVYLVADLDQPNTSRFIDYQVVVTSIPGATEAELNIFAKHLKEVHGKRIIAKLAATRSRNFNVGYTYHGSTKNTGTHHWSVFTMQHGQQTTPQLQIHYLTQSETQLSKRRIQEIGLMDYMDTIMSVTDYNNLDIEEASKLELML